MGKILGYGEITVANMTEPFTVMLTNEAQQFATDSNRKVTSAQSYYTDIIVIRGSQERTDYTIGNITSGSGITVSKSSKRVTFSVSAGATIGADTGVIEIPITLDGQTVKKQFSWSCGKQGPQGVKGENGNKGKSVQSVIEYYLATSASSGVTSSTSGWSTDPTTQKLTAEKKYLWNCKQTVYDDGARGSITAPVICGTYGEKGDKGDDGLNGTNLWINPLFESDKPQLWTVADGVTAPNGSKVNKLANRDHHNNDTAFPVFPGHQYRITVYRKLISGTVTLKAGIWYTEQTSGVAYDTYVDTSSTTSLTDGWEEATYNFTVPNGKSKGCVYFQIEQPNSGGTTTWYISNVTCVDITGLKGSDGISPKVTLSKSGDTTTISIVDATGTHTQTVKDGTNGTPGAAGKDGKTSYFHVKYSNDGGKTFTGNSGEDTGIYMGSYTDYTEADSTDVGKYTWIKVKGDKGDTGQKGQDGTSIKITSKSVTYQTSTSGTTAPTGTWSTTVPTVNNGQYLWTKTTVQYSDGNKTEAYSVSYKGTNGTNGTSVTVSKTEVTYQVSTSGTTAPTGTWSTTMPSCDQGQYLWTKTYVKYSDGKETTSYSVSYKGVDGEKFSWNLINNGKGNEKRGFFKNFSSVNITEGYGETTLTSKHNYISIGLPGFVLSPRQYEVGKKVTWSYDIMYTKWDFPTGSNRQEYWMGQRYTNAASGETATGQWVGVTSHDLPVVGQNGCELNKWFHVEVTKTIPTQASSNVGHQEVINFYNSTDISATVTFRMKNVKLEYGDTATPWSPSQSDLEGRGVSQTVQYYLATSQASGVTSSTSGWSTDITTQKLTADKKYLWNCYQTKYSDGTSEPISTPKVIGVYGDKGQKGDSGEDGQDGAGFHWNLLSGTKDFDKTKMSIAGATSFDSQKYLGLTVIKAVSPTSGYIDPVAWNGTITPTPNTQYTISFYAKASVETRIASFFHPNCTIKNISNYHTTTAPDGCAMTKLSTEWNRYSVTWTTSSSVSGAKGIIPIRLEHGNTTDGATVYLCGIKLEQSDKPSPWCTTYEETLAKNLSITPSSQYFKSTDGGKTFAPNTITIKPTIQGEISFGKWQYSIDGGVSFADVVSGQKGLTVNNNVLAVSKDSSLYSDAVTMVTFRAVANDSSFYDTCSIAKIYDVSDIGDGRNLLTGVSSYTKDTPFEKTDSRADGWIVYQNIITSIELEAGKKYVLQAKTDGNWTANHDINGQDPSKKLVSLWLCSDTTNDFFDMRQGYVVFTPTVTAKYKLRVNQYSNGTDDYTIRLWDIKLEKGSSPTGWTPAPEDVQTAILSTKSEISDVSLKVDKNKQAIEQRVEKTTYQQDLNLVKGDISKANEGLNKWRYEIYPKSLFTDKPEDQSKYDIGVFIRNKNLTPSQSVLLDDASLSTGMDYGDSHIAYGLTFIKMSAAKSITTTFYNDDGASFYVNGKLIISRASEYTNGQEITFTLVQGWNCIEVVVNEDANTEGFKLGTTLSALSECQLMNCYYGTPVARQSHITNQLVQNTTDIDGISGSVQQVMSTVGGSGKVDEFVNNYSTWKKKVDDIETRVGKTYVTKNDFNGLEVGGRNLVLGSKADIWKNGKEIDSDGYTEGYTEGIGSWNEYYPKLSFISDDNNKISGHITISAYVKCPQNMIGNACFGFNITNSNGRVADWNINLMYFTNHEKINDNTWTYITYTTEGFSSDFNYNGTIHLQIKTNPSFTKGSKFWYKKIKVEKGNKATDWTPAPEDNEINGQNLVSNLPSNWEQGSFDGSRVDVGGTYSTGKVDNSTIIRVKELVPVSGSITISNAYSNQSKKPIQHYIVAFDVDKKYLGSSYVSTAWNDFPRIVDMKDAKYIAVIVRYKDESAITPSDISQICLKIERGTSATPFTLALEDVNGKIVNVETIANQTAKKFEWIVKGESTSSNLALTDNALTAIANNINLTGKVTFNSFDQSLKDTINNKTNVSYLSLSSGGNNQACWKIATIKISGNYTNQDIIIGVNHRGHGYTECRIQFKNAGNPDPGLASFRQTGLPSKCWRIIKTANSTWELYLYKNESWDGGYVVKYINPYHTTGNVSVTWSGENADLPSGTTTTEQMIADQTTIDGGIITTGYISADRIAAGSITADKIATDAIKSRNYISSGGTQGSFLNLSDGSFTSPNLSWDSNGNLIAKNANLSGEITATKGTIGKYEITDQWLTTGSGSTCTGIGGNQAFWAGGEDSNSAPFRVGYDGKLTSSNADITGTITATNGKIGRYDITSTYLMTNSGSNASGIGGNQAFWAGAEDSNSAPFRVGYDGVLWAENAAIRGSIETGNLGDEGDTVSIINGHIGIRGTSNNVEIYSTGFKFGIDGDYYLESVSEGVKCYRNLYATDFIADGWIYNASGGHYTWKDRDDAYISCGDYNGHNVYYYANYHAFYVNKDSGQGMMYINTNGVTSRVGFTKTSDERIKKNFESFDDNIIDAYMNIEPVKYQLKQSSNDKYHFGFKAQHIDKVFSDYGDIYNESFDICTSRPIDPDKAKELYGVDGMVEEYGLRYDELIAPTAYMVQHIYKELEQTKQEKVDLEARLQAIEEKLGL